MSGHSKWAQIKRQKGVADAKKGVAFTKLANAITLMVREGGKDPSMNFRLRLAVEKAREANMPKDNIERAIKRGAGELSDRPIEAVTYEGYGPAGAAVVVETLTDNRNRTATELRQIFSTNGGSLGSANSVLWMFERRGYLEVESGDRNAVELAAIDAGAIDTVDEGTILAVYTKPTDLRRVRDAVAATGATVVTAELSLVPTTTVTPTSEEERQYIQNFLLALEDNQDVTNVASNVNL